MSVEIPKGLMPPLCVYFCCTPAMYLVRYSTETFSSSVNLQPYSFDFKSLPQTTVVLAILQSRVNLNYFSAGVSQ